MGIFIEPWFPKEKTDNNPSPLTEVWIIKCYALTSSSIMIEPQEDKAEWKKTVTIETNSRKSKNFQTKISCPLNNVSIGGADLSHN